MLPKYACSEGAVLRSRDKDASPNLICVSRFSCFPLSFPFPFPSLPFHPLISLFFPLLPFLLLLHSLPSSPFPPSPPRSASFESSCGVWEHCELPQRCSGQSLGRKAFLAHFGHRRSQGCNGCTCTPRAEKFFLRNLQGKFVSAPQPHQVHSPGGARVNFLGHFLLC